MHRSRVQQMEGECSGAEQQKLCAAASAYLLVSSEPVDASARPAQSRASELRLASAQPRPRIGANDRF